MKKIDRMHWKIKRDSYYHSLYKSLGRAGIEEAGFFFDTAGEDVDIRDSIDWLCTPFHFQELEAGKLSCVLLSTGAFCPVHKGHIEMMALAKKTVEANGYQVLAGYMSPGHDEYISQKAGEKAISIQERIALIQKEIDASAERDWLMLDPWEGLFCRVAVNFTDVIERLQAYLEKHSGGKIPVFYVCGGDNARFSLTFLEKGHCVVVGRPPYEDAFNYYRKQLQGSPDTDARILWVMADNPLNSSEIRNSTDFQAASPCNLKLRVEEQDEREALLIQILEKHFQKINFHYLSQQKSAFQQLDKSPLLSLDSLLTSDYNLAISRCFDLFGLRHLGFCHRPGSPALALQLEKLNEYSAYYLFDDDMHSGETMKFATDLLSGTGIEILGILTLHQGLYDFSETLDCRDFLIGGSNNGLVIRLGADLLRVPYCYPYCSPFARASVFDSMGFSKAVWQLNRDYFAVKGSALKDLPKTWQHLFSYIGFGLESLLEEICDWHLERLIACTKLP